MFYLFFSTEKVIKIGHILVVVVSNISSNFVVCSLFSTPLSCLIILCSLIICQLPGKVQEMNGSMTFMVKFFGIFEHQIEAHVNREVLPIEIVVPDAPFRYHEVAQEFV